MISINEGQNAGMIPCEDALELVKNEVVCALTKSPFIIREYMSHLSLSQGKYIRARSVLVSSENQYGQIHSNAIKVAAAIEIVHLASLVHDDIIDNAELRRGRETLQKKYGRRTAVICGDYLLSLAIKMVSEVSDKKAYADMKIPDYISRMCLGELEQHVNNQNIHLSVYRYLKIISGKTAALFEAAFFSGAIIADCNEKEAKQYKKLGYYIGMIFQLMDDCIDFETSEEIANKPVQSDYEQGVITLPLIHALHVLSDFKNAAENLKITRKDINNAVAKSGGLIYTKMVVKKYYDKAMGCLESVELSEGKRAKIIDILNKASGRK